MNIKLMRKWINVPCAVLAPAVQHRNEPFCFTSFHHLFTNQNLIFLRPRMNTHSLPYKYSNMHIYLMINTRMLSHLHNNAPFSGQNTKMHINNMKYTYTYAPPKLLHCMYFPCAYIHLHTHVPTPAFAHAPVVPWKNSRRSWRSLERTWESWKCRKIAPSPPKRRMIGSSENWPTNLR